MFFTPLSLSEKRQRIDQKYRDARERLMIYKNQMPEIYHVPLDQFITHMNRLYEQAKVPTAALINAFKKTEGFLKGTVPPDAYERFIHESNRAGASSFEPSRLSQVMKTLSWAVWVISLACLLSGALLLGVLGMFASVAMHHDAEHSEVKYPHAYGHEDARIIAEEMDKIQKLNTHGVQHAAMV